MTQRITRFAILLVAAALVLAMTGCTTAPVYRNVNVEVPVECRETVPERPVMPTEQFTAKPTVDQYVQGAQAEIERREGYEHRLRTALQACTAPIAPI